MSESVRERQIISGEEECGIHTLGQDGGRVNQFSVWGHTSIIDPLPTSGIKREISWIQWPTEAFSFLISYESFIMQQTLTIYSSNLETKYTFLICLAPLDGVIIVIIVISTITWILICHFFCQ